MRSVRNTLKMNEEIKKRVGFQRTCSSKRAWKGVKIPSTSSLMSPVGVSQKRLQFCEWHKVFEP